MGIDVFKKKFSNIVHHYTPCALVIRHVFLRLDGDTQSSPGYIMVHLLCPQFIAVVPLEPN